MFFQSGNINTGKFRVFKPVHSIKKCDSNQINESALINNQCNSSQDENELLDQLKQECGLHVWELCTKKYSIKSVLTMVFYCFFIFLIQASTNLLPRGKVPIMCGFLDDIELLPTDAKALLKDNTGNLVVNYLFIRCYGVYNSSIRYSGI